MFLKSSNADDKPIQKIGCSEGKKFFGNKSFNGKTIGENFFIRRNISPLDTAIFLN